MLPAAKGALPGMAGHPGHPQPQQGRALAQAVAGTRPSLLGLARWGLNPSLCLPRCLPCGSGWMDLGESRSTGPCACPNPLAGSRPECPVRPNVFTFGCSWSPGLGPGQRALLVEAACGAVQLELSPGSTGPGEYFVSPPHSS